MHEASAWSVSFGRWGGITIRLHALFIFFGVFTIFLSSRSSDPDLVWYGVLSLMILFVSVLCHELGHCYAALRMGGHVDEIIIGPFGGLGRANVPHDPRSELIVSAAGPIVNLLIWLVTIPLLLLGSDTNVFALLNPLRPEHVVDPPGPIIILKLIFWLNWILVLVNLLPAFPFDGSWILRALLWKKVGYPSAITYVARIAKLIALGVCVYAYLTHSPQATHVIPTWVPLALVAMFLYFSANQEVAKLQQREITEELMDYYDYPESFSTTLEPEPEPLDDQPSMLRRWLKNRREEKERRRREVELAEEHRVDEILARLHGRSLDILTPEERSLLQRVSARYRDRNRLQQ